MSQSLCFNDVILTLVPYQNNLWIRGAELARALGYSREDKVSRIYDRNSDEFTPDMTQVIEIVDTPELGFPVKARIFSLRGCHLIAMFARTPIAKSFRRWVLDVLEKYGDRVQPQPEQTTPSISPATSDSPLTPDQQCTLQTIVKAKVEAIPKEQRSGGLYPQIWSRFNNHFRIAKYNQLPQSKLSEAIAYLMALEIKEEKKALPELKALPAAKLAIEEDIELFAEEVRQAHAQIYALREQSEKRIIERATEIMSTLALRFTRKAHPSEQGKVGILVVNFSPYVVSKCQMALRDTSDQLYSFENPASLLMSYADIESRW